MVYWDRATASAFPQPSEVGFVLLEPQTWTVIAAAQKAGEKAKGSVMATDSFFAKPDAVEEAAKRCQMFHVNQRWLGGMLTNFRTIRSRLGRLEELETILQGDKISTYSKKMQSSLNREYRKMYRNLNGMRTMNRLPEAMVIIDPKKEKNAVREARKMGITTVALIDTDCDPDEVDLPIPGNDDSIHSIELILQQLADAVVAGRAASGALKGDQPAQAPTGNGQSAAANKE